MITQVLIGSAPVPALVAASRSGGSAAAADAEAAMATTVEPPGARRPFLDRPEVNDPGELDFMVSPASRYIASLAP